MLRVCRATAAILKLACVGCSDETLNVSEKKLARAILDIKVKAIIGRVDSSRREEQARHVRGANLLHVDVQRQRTDRLKASLQSVNSALGQPKNVTPQPDTDEEEEEEEQENVGTTRNVRAEPVRARRSTRAAKQPTKTSNEEEDEDTDTVAALPNTPVGKKTSRRRKRRSVMVLSRQYA